jgi:hypothetical protein
MVILMVMMMVMETVLIMVLVMVMVQLSPLLRLIITSAPSIQLLQLTVHLYEVYKGNGQVLQCR